MTPKLSILICSLGSRKHLLERLLAHLETQLRFLPDNSQVEILVETDNGEKTTGEKRNILLNRAAGEYIQFVDDDDLLSPVALETILKTLHCSPGVDALGINLIMTWDGWKTERSFHYSQFLNEDWWDSPDPLFKNTRTYWRGANHLNPIKKELALQVGFPDVSQGEDRVYALEVSKLIKTMVDIPQPIYFYLFNSQK